MSTPFDMMAKQPAAWLSGKGEDALVVLSTRVRLARNVAGCHYPPSADSEMRKRIVQYIDSSVSRSQMLAKGIYCKGGDVSPLDRDFLVERHLISPMFLTGDMMKSFWIGGDERVTIMVNEEDHLRIQALSAGFDPGGAFELALAYEHELSRFLEYDYDRDFGYLTACPTNAGTGMRASALIHLPGLVLTREIDKLISKITRAGLIVRGFYGEGSDVLGNLFQISNQYTLGVSESDILQLIRTITAEIIEAEAQARQRLMDEASDMIEDKIWRAFGILKNARMLTADEVMNLLSAVRLGHALKIITFLTTPLINDLLLLSQPAHLQKYFGQELDDNRRDFVRAQLMREKLRSVG